jgi:hypothetical protein
LIVIKIKLKIFFWFLFFLKVVWKFDHFVFITLLVIERQ